MKLFFDECVGTAVPQALRLVNVDHVLYLQRQYARIIKQQGRLDDVDWLRDAGRQKWLVVTEDLQMLEQPQERQAIIDANVGIVFVRAGNESRRDVLAFMLRRLRWFEQIDLEERPFAYRTTLRSRPRRVVL